MPRLSKVGAAETVEATAGNTITVDPPKEPEANASDALAPPVTPEPPSDRIAALEGKISMLTEILNAQGLSSTIVPSQERVSFGSRPAELPYPVDTRAKEMGKFEDDDGITKAVSAHFLLIDNEGDMTVIVENAEAMRVGENIIRDESSGRRLKFISGHLDTQSKSAARYLVDHRMYGILWTIDPEDPGHYWREIGLVKEQKRVVTSIDKSVISESREELTPQPSTSA
ncbi:MAG: hypothetical protein ACE5GA_00175 [Candidatus Zixiibacteriota bacterium]